MGSFAGDRPRPQHQQRARSNGRFCPVGGPGSGQFWERRWSWAIRGERSFQRIPEDSRGFLKRMLGYGILASTDSRSSHLLMGLLKIESYGILPTYWNLSWLSRCFYYAITITVLRIFAEYCGKSVIVFIVVCWSIIPYTSIFECSRRVEFCSLF